MKITNIKVRRILDSRGEETIELSLTLNEKYEGKASVPMGKSVGSHEAICLDCEKIEKNLPTFLEEASKFNFQTQKDLDQFLINYAGKRKEKIGVNFTLAVSISFARALSKSKNQELFEYLRNEFNLYNNIRVNPRINPHKSALNDKINLPKLMINIIGGGVHSFNNLNFQEYWLVSKEGFSYELIGKILSIINQLERKLPKPLGRNEEGALCANFENNLEPVKLLKEIAFEKFDLGIDVAANQVDLTIDELFQIYRELEKLEVKYLEDPYKEDDFEHFANLREERFKVIGDDLTATNPERLKIALEKNSIDGVIVKPNQIGTILETFEFVKLAKENNLFTIFSHRSGETNDDWIIDLGIAFSADFFKIGPPLQGERVEKYNRLLEIIKY
jgi:enolase